MRAAVIMTVALCFIACTSAHSNLKTKLQLVSKVDAALDPWDYACTAVGTIPTRYTADETTGKQGTCPGLSTTIFGQTIGLPAVGCAYSCDNLHPAHFTRATQCLGKLAAFDKGLMAQGFIWGLFSKFMTTGKACVDDSIKAIQTIVPALSPPQNVAALPGWFKALHTAISTTLPPAVSKCSDLITMVKNLITKLSGAAALDFTKPPAVDICYAVHYINNANDACDSKNSKDAKDTGVKCPYDYGFFLGAALHALATR